MEFQKSETIRIKVMYFFRNKLNLQFFILQIVSFWRMASFLYEVFFSLWGHDTTATISDANDQEWLKRL